MIGSRTPCLLVLCAAAALGCRPEPQITQYTIPKPDSIQLPAAKPGQPAGTESTAGRPERMLAAIVPGGDQVWFFKLTGPVDPVAAQSEPFREFVKSIRFRGGKPDWTLPTGWTRQPGEGMRFATVTIDSDPPLELTVTALPSSDDSVEQTLANVNRWRGQLSLPPIAATDLGKETESIPTDAGAVATVVNLVGTSKGGGMMAAPFAGGGMINPPKLTSSAAPPSLKYDTPEGWTPGEAKGMRKAAFQVRDGDHKAELTVIDLAKEAGDRLANVNRWRGQIGLGPVAADELKAQMKSLPVGPLTGDYVELISTEGGDVAQSILGMIVDRDDKTWFVKLQGATPLVLSQKDEFAAFVKSLSFK